MSFRPAGDSSDEDDEFNGYSMSDDYMTENEMKEQNARKLYEERLKIQNLPVTKVYNAIVNGNLELLRKELDNNFFIETKVFNQLTPLLLAASVGRYDMVDELLKRGANPKAEDEGFNVLMAACSCPKQSTTAQNIVNIVKKLLEYNLDVQEIDRKRRTALMLACEQGFIEVVYILEPLSDLEAEDNRGWTALFYAVDAKNIEIYVYLYQQGANYNHMDLREYNLRYYATMNECYDILKQIPNDEDVYTDELIQIEQNYDQVFYCLENNIKPSFKDDLALLLYGMKCENLVDLFSEDYIELNTFLILDNDELEMFGVDMSFQRNRILQGIYRFHEHSWRKTSIPFIPKNGYYTTSDLFEIVTTAIKHIIIMESTINYLDKNYCFMNCDRLDVIASKIQRVQQKIKSMKVIVEHLHKRAIKYDAIGYRPDLINQDFSFRKNSFNKAIVMGLVGTATLFILYCKLK